MAQEIRLALESASRRRDGRAATLLAEALDALGDGMPADHVAALLYAAGAGSGAAASGAGQGR